jgi:hypothetical protein
MGTGRFAGVVGIAWVIVTAAGIILFSAAGALPLFDDAAAYARFTSGSATLFFGMGAMATLAVAIVRTGVVASWARWLWATWAGASAARVPPIRDHSSNTQHSPASAQISSCTGTKRTPHLQ